SPKGGVYNLTSRLSDPVGERRSFHFALALAPGAEAAPQLLLAVATGNPLVNAAAARDGSNVKVLLPLIAREIAEGGGKGVAALSHILLTQPASAPTGDDSTDPPVEDIPEADQ
ncbi:MAG: serine/threonine protein kinase, partial [Rhodobacterales bacterium]